MQVYALSKYLTMTISTDDTDKMPPIQCHLKNKKQIKRKHIFSFIIYTNHTQQTNKSKTLSLYLWGPY